MRHLYNVSLDMWLHIKWE